MASQKTGFNRAGSGNMEEATIIILKLQLQMKTPQTSLFFLRPSSSFWDFGISFDPPFFVRRAGQMMAKCVKVDSEVFFFERQLPREPPTRSSTARSVNKDLSMFCQHFLLLQCSNQTAESTSGVSRCQCSKMPFNRCAVCNSLLTSHVLDSLQRLK